MAIADAAQYEVRKCDSGILLYSSTSATAYQDCVTQATVLAAEYPAAQLCVIPQGYGVISDRPPIPFPYPTAGQPVLLQRS